MVELSTRKLPAAYVRVATRIRLLCSVQQSQILVTDPVHQTTQTGLHVVPAGEQTWPTDEELAAAAAGAKKMRKRRLPPGTSEYQAAWILDDDDGSDLEESDDASDGKRQLGS